MAPDIKSMVSPMLAALGETRMIRKRAASIPPVESSVGIRTSRREPLSFAGISPGGRISITDDSMTFSLRVLILYSSDSPSLKI